MMNSNVPVTIVPNPKLRKEVEEVSGQNISTCFQCGKCTNGCPITFAMDISPHKLVHLIQYGQVEEVLHSDTIWVCASCQTCTTRCPNGIDIAHLMDRLRQLSQRQGIRASQYSVPIFHKAFLSSIRRHGRVHETEMALTYSIEDAGWFGFLKLTGLGFAMFLKGKAKLRPSRIRALNNVRNLFKKAEGSSL
ncbi:MAG: 4Fe-4S dicluster domain-containing protein [Dehalococcoidales bacterium]|nr:4Fe-4S dicluster domain-containing protein [Dehalococcoidales bacterium]